MEASGKTEMRVLLMQINKGVVLYCLLLDFKMIEQYYLEIPFKTKE